MPLILVYITHPDKETARRVVDHLLTERLIACANLLPIESAYWWQGAIEHAEETVTICKTNEEHWEAVRDEVAKMHPYDVPCIVRIGAEANQAFSAWIDTETT